MNSQRKSQPVGDDAETRLSSIVKRAKSIEQHASAIREQGNLVEAMNAVEELVRLGTHDEFSALSLVARIGPESAIARAHDHFCDHVYDDEPFCNLMKWFERVEANPFDPAKDRTPSEISAVHETALEVMQSIVAGNFGLREIEFVRGLVRAIYRAGTADLQPRARREAAVLKATALFGKRHTHDELVHEVSDLAQDFRAFAVDDELEDAEANRLAQNMAIKHVMNKGDFGDLTEQEIRKEISRAEERNKRNPT